jgi:hypothetical protein
LHDPYLLPRFLMLHCRALPDYPVVISIVAIPVKANAAGIRHAPARPASNARLKSVRRGILMVIGWRRPPQRGRDFAPERSANRRSEVISCPRFRGRERGWSDIALPVFAGA